MFQLVVRTPLCSMWMPIPKIKSLVQSEIKRNAHLNLYHIIRKKKVGKAKYFIHPKPNKNGNKGDNINVIIPLDKGDIHGLYPPTIVLPTAISRMPFNTP